MASFLGRVAMWFYRMVGLWPFAGQRRRARLFLLNDFIEIQLTEDRLEDAMEKMPAYLALVREVHGENPTGGPAVECALRQADLGAALQVYGRDSESADLFQKALDFFQEYAGPEDSAFALAVQNLGCALQRASRSEEAVGWLSRAKELYRGHFGDDSFRMAQCHANLGVVYRNLGRFAESEAELRQAVARHRQHSGKESEGVAIALNNLSGTLVKMARPEEAQQEALRAVRIFELLGHGACADALDTLADAYKGQGRYNEALMTRDQALSRIAGQRRQAEMAVWMKKQAHVLGCLGRDDDARRYLEQAEQVERGAYFALSVAEETAD